MSPLCEASSIRRGCFARLARKLTSHREATESTEGYTRRDILTKGPENHRIPRLGRALREKNSVSSVIPLCEASSIRHGCFARLARKLTSHREITESTEGYTRRDILTKGPENHRILRLGRALREKNSVSSVSPLCEASSIRHGCFARLARKLTSHREITEGTEGYARRDILTKGP